MDRKSMQAHIRRHGSLPGGQAYRKLAQTIYHPRRSSNGGGRRVGSTTSRLTGVEEIGNLPAAYDQVYTWDRMDNYILLAAFVNAADPLGVCIAGIQSGDTISVTSASGIASFAEDKGSPFASSLVTLAAAGANVAAVMTGNPALLPLVTAAETFAKAQFAPSEVKHKRRDAFGVDPADGLKARQEGGILISLPQAGRVYYSGNGDHRERWISKPGDRFDALRPAHVTDGFFLVPGGPERNTRRATSAGEVYVSPWDWMHDDNAGYYRVLVLITKAGNAPPVEPEG
jgi:hypothetical protein